MSVDFHPVRRLLLAPDVLGTASVLVVPVALTALDTSFVTPLALPGYLLLTVGSWYGSHLFPTYALWVFWIPFVAGSYFVAVCVGAGWRIVVRVGRDG